MRLNNIKGKLKSSTPYLNIKSSFKNIINIGLIKLQQYNADHKQSNQSSVLEYKKVEDRQIVKCLLDHIGYDINQIKLHKLLFLIDVIHIGKYDTSMFNSSFEATEMGPRLNHIDNYIVTKSRNIPKYLFSNRRLDETKNEKAKSLIQDNIELIKELSVIDLTHFYTKSISWNNAYGRYIRSHLFTDGLIRKEEMKKDYENLTYKVILAETNGMSLERKSKIKL